MVFKTQHVVEIILETMDKSTKQWVPIQKQVEKVTQGLTGMKKEIEYSKWAENDWQKVQKKTIYGMHRFRMELLSVMFFGMNLSRMFRSWLEPAAEALGIFDIWTSTLQVVFLPVMEAIFPYLLQFMDWFMNLPEPVKMAIGSLTLVGFVVGKLLTTIGVLGLGLDGLRQMFGIGSTAAKGAAGVVGTASTSILSSLGPILLIIGAIIAIIIVLYLAWKNNWLGFRDIVTAVVDKAVGVLKFLQNVWVTVFNVIVSFLKAAAKVLAIPFKFILGFFQGLLESLGITKETWLAVWDAIANKVKWVWDHVFSPIFDKIKGFFDWIGRAADRLGDLASKAGKAVGGMIGGTAKKIVSRQHGGIVPGRLGEPVPIIAHGGERFLGIHGGGAGETIINFNPSYNINVSDKDELERMIRDSNERMMTELKRMVGG